MTNQVLRALSMLSVERMHKFNQYDNEYYSVRFRKK